MLPKYHRPGLRPAHKFQGPTKFTPKPLAASVQFLESIGIDWLARIFSLLNHAITLPVF
jgi:hypothetical protein